MTYRRFRKHFSLTQDELAQLLNITKIAVAKSEQKGDIPEKNYLALSMVHKVCSRYKTHSARQSAIEREKNKLKDIL